VKPKIESNIIVMVLLFLFPLFSAAHSSVPSDTLIIDGEIIFIEKQEITVNVDSMEKVARNDVQEKPVRKSFITAGIYSGLNLTATNFSTSSGNFVTLDDFMQKPPSVQANFLYGADVCAKIWSFENARSDVEIGVMAGINFNRIRIVSRGIDDELPFALDSVLQLRFVQDELLLDYFRITTFPFGELDTAAIDYSSKLTEYKTIDVPLALRFSLVPKKSVWRYFAEVGLNVRRLQPGGSSHDQFLVNELGELSVLRKNEFKPVNQIRPLFALGVEGKLPKSDEHLPGFFSVGFKATTNLPAAAFNAGSLFVMEFSSHNFVLFLRRTF
jgi:hypothetical protein